MLLHKESQGDLIEKLTPHCGAKSFPVDVKVKIFGNELELKLYTKMTVKEFMESMAA